MKKIKSKKQKETTHDRHLKWINYYCSKNFGIWVECTDCKKWRRTFQYSESHEVPNHWCCSLLTLENGKKGSCDDPEEDTDEQYLEYCPGSVVWAKLEGYPWWPGMVDEDPDVEEFSWREKGTLHYNITFLDEKPTRAWIPEMFISPFLNGPKKEKGSLLKYKQNRYGKTISKAKERAEAAMKMAIKDRLQTYSFVHLYKGHWPKAPNFEETSNEENKNTNTEDIADILMKELDELGSICSTDTDIEKIEDFSGEENNMAKEERLFSKNSDIPNSRKKTYNTKYLNNKEFIPKNEAVFPFMKKKKKYPSSHNETLKNAKYTTLVRYAENNIDPPLENKAKKTEMKTIRKFTPKKEKNVKKSTHSITDVIIDVEASDSEYENNETLKAVNVSEESSGSEVNVEEVQYSSTVSKTLSNAKHPAVIECGENITDSLQEKEAEGIKMKANKKFTPGEEKNFKKSTHSVTENNTNVEDTYSEREGDETLKAVNVPEEGDNNSINVPEESSMCEDNENDLPKIHGYEKFNTQKQTDRVEPFNGQELNKKANISPEKSLHLSPLSSQEEILKHIDESISKVLEFIEEESAEIFNECNNSEQSKIVKRCNELHKKSIKQKKSQKTVKKIKLSNDKIENFGDFEGKKIGKKIFARPSQVHSETKVLQNVSNSTLNINKQIINGATKLIKKPIENKMNKLPKQSFPIPIKNSAEQGDEVVVNKDAITTKINKEKKMSKLKSLNLQKDQNPSVKGKSTFKLPIKADKQISHSNTKDVKIPANNEKEKLVDINQKNFDDSKESSQQKMIESNEDKNNSMIKKLNENLQLEKLISEPKEKVIEIISIDEEDSLPNNDTMKTTECNDDNFFYVSVSDEEMDCETSND